MKKIGIIVNPFAKKIRTGKISPDSVKKFESDHFKIFIPESKIELNNCIKFLKNNKFDYIGILGGDGTIHLTLTGIINFFGEKNIPPILLLKGGTMDNIARSVGLKGGTKKVLARASAVINSGSDIPVTTRDTIKIKDSYCFLFGFGAVTSFLNEAYSGSEKGFVRNAAVVLKAVWQAAIGLEKGSIFEKTNAEILADGKQIAFKNITAVLSGTVEHIGMGFTPLSRSNEKSGTFHSIITAVSPLTVLKNIFSLRKGKKIDHPLNYDNLTSSLKIKSDKPFQYTMDGDLYDSYDVLEVNCGPIVSFLIV